MKLLVDLLAEAELSAQQRTAIGKLLKKYKFTKISYEEFERLQSSSDDYHETEIDGQGVIVVTAGKCKAPFPPKEDRCIAIWYKRAKMGTKCEDFGGDMIFYAEQDPHK